VQGILSLSAPFLFLDIMQGLNSVCVGFTSNHLLMWCELQHWSQDTVGMILSIYFFHHKICEVLENSLFLPPSLPPLSAVRILDPIGEFIFCHCNCLRKESIHMLFKMLQIATNPCKRWNFDFFPHEKCNCCILFKILHDN